MKYYNKMKMTIMDPELFRQHLENKGNVRYGTIKTYLDVVKRFYKENPNLETIDSYNNFLIKYAVKKGMGHYLYAIKKFIKYKIEDVKLRRELLDNLTNVKFKDRTTERAPLSTKQMFEVINHLQEYKHKLIAKLQVHAGLRSSDVIWLKKNNIFEEEDEKTGKIILRLRLESKGGHSRITYLFDETVKEELLDYANNYSSLITLPDEKIEDYYVFLRMPSRIRLLRKPNTFSLLRRAYDCYWYDLKQACQSVGLSKEDWATHDFRRDFAKKIYERYSNDIFLLKEALGHQRIETTAKYLKDSGLIVKDKLRSFQQTYKVEKHTKEVELLEDEVFVGFKKGSKINYNDLTKACSEEVIKDLIEKNQIKII